MVSGSIGALFGSIFQARFFQLRFFQCRFFAGRNFEIDVSEIVVTVVTAVTVVTQVTEKRANTYLYLH